MIINLGYAKTNDKIEVWHPMGFSFWIEKSDNPFFEGQHPIWQYQHNIIPSMIFYVPGGTGYYRFTAGNIGKVLVRIIRFGEYQS